MNFVYGFNKIIVHLTIFKNIVKYLKFDFYSYNCLMEKLSIEKLKEKYSNIEDKIPSVWPDYEKAGIELAQDLSFGHWDIKDSELIRVISLVELEVRGLSIAQHIDPKFSFAGLYPHKMKTYNIVPGESMIGSKELVDLINELKNKRDNGKQ